jgi:hypothetical protein
MDDVCRFLHLQLDRAGIHRADLLDLVGTIAPMAHTLNSMTGHYLTEYPRCREALLADAASTFLVDAVGAVLLRGFTTPASSYRHRCVTRFTLWGISISY